MCVRKRSSVICPALAKVVFMCPRTISGGRSTPWAKRSTASRRFAIATAASGRAKET